MPISPLKNEFLAKLPEPDYDRLRQMLQAVLLKKGQVLYVQGSSPDMIYFPVSTVVSFLLSLATVTQSKPFLLEERVSLGLLFQLLEAQV